MKTIIIKNKNILTRAINSLYGNSKKPYKNKYVVSCCMPKVLKSLKDNNTFFFFSNKDYINNKNYECYNYRIDKGNIILQYRVLK